MHAYKILSEKRSHIFERKHEGVYEGDWKEERKIKMMQ